MILIGLIKIVVDTNVLVSSSFWYGSSDRIMNMVEQEKVKLFLSRHILKEFVTVLAYDEIQKKVADKKLEMKRTIDKIISLSTIIEPNEKIFVCEDVDDNIILECALEGKVNFIISQDDHLLKLREFRGIRIVAPEEFLILFERL